MILPIRVCLILAAMLGLYINPCAAETAPKDEAKINVKVVYFGYPQTTRAKDFADFLGDHFVKVGRGDLEQFREEDAAGFDVVILDYGELRIVGNRIQMPKNIVSARFSRPTVTIGATGALVCERLGLKTGYL